MPVCKRCGRKHSIFMHVPGTGLCGKCSDAEWQKKVEQIKQETNEKARQELAKIIAQYAPGATLEQAGVACWGKCQDKVHTMMGKTMGLFFLGPLGTKGEVLQYTYGVIAINEKDLFVLEFGTWPDENIKADKISAKTLPKIKKFSITDIEVNRGSFALHVRGAVNLEATFPDSYSDDNSLKGRRIAEAIIGLKEKKV